MLPHEHTILLDFSSEIRDTPMLMTMLAYNLIFNGLICYITGSNKVMGSIDDSV